MFLYRLHNDIKLKRKKYNYIDKEFYFLAPYLKLLGLNV